MREKLDIAEDNSVPYLFPRVELRLYCFLLCLMIGYSTSERWNYYNRLEAQRFQQSTLAVSRKELSDRVASSAPIFQLTNSYCPIKK